MYSENNLINPVPDNNVDEKIWGDLKNKFQTKEKISYNNKVQNTDRAVGTKLSHYIFQNSVRNYQRIFCN